MSLVLSRKNQEGVEVVTPSGVVKFTVVKIKSKLVQLAVDCDKEWIVNRVTPEGLVEKYSQKQEEKKEVVYPSYNIEELKGKNLEMFVGVDKMHGTDKTIKMLIGKDRNTNKMYVLREEII